MAIALHLDKGPQPHQPPRWRRAPRAAVAMLALAGVKAMTMSLSLATRLLDGPEPALD